MAATQPLALQPPFIGRRSPVLATRGMVACSQPLAAEAGLSILKAGGNCIDAAVAVAAALQVCEPCSTGLGGDCFVLHYDAATRAVSGLNGSGRSPAALTLDRARSDFAQQTAGPSSGQFPPLHAHAITVPGAAAGWVDAVQKWGTLPMSSVLAPAIRLAREGFPVSPITAHSWAAGVRVLQHHPASAASELLLDGGTRAPRAGELFRNPALANTLEELARGGKEGFYSGRIASAIVEAVRASGGVMSLGDLAGHISTFPEPVSVVYRGVRVWEIPPNGQGIAALLALNSLSAMQGEATRLAPIVVAAAKETDTAAAAARGSAHAPCPSYCSPPPPPHPGPAQWGLRDLGPASSPASLHLQIEAMRLAFADSRWYICDPAVHPVPTGALLSPSYASARAAHIHPYAAAADVQKGVPVCGTDTVSFQVVDAHGNAASFINSNYMGFGSGLVPTGCGFSLQNRGAGFSLEPGHPNALAPAKRPYHTIIPGLATLDASGELFATFSNMGGFMQPQGHLQLMLNMLDHGADVQTAIDMPRWCISDGEAGGGVSFEEGIPAATVAALRARGHVVKEEGVSGFARSLFGRAQIIYRDPANGVLWGGSDGRGDGCAMGW